MIVLLALAAAAWADGSVQGVILDEATGAPVRGAVVRLQGTEGQALTDDDGVFSITVPAGEWAVEVEADGRVVPAGTVPVVDGAVTELLVSLTAGDRPIVTLEVPAAAAAATDADAPRFDVQGRVVGEDGEPIAGARVYARGQTAEGVTDETGTFTLPLPPGAHDLSVLRSGYVTLTLPPVVVGDDGAHGPVEVVMAEAGVALAPFEVRAPRIAGGTASLLDERRDAATVSDTLGSEQMTKSGDSDAASGLRGVTGITVVDGRYVYVRGLGDRYSATLLNGSTLPSPEPEKRVVPLDLFPTSVIESVVIQKTFSPDRPAEFGGGIVQIQTRSVPDERVLQVAASIGYRTGTSFGSAISGVRSPTDFLGFGRKDRAMPDLVTELASDEPVRPKGLFTEGGFEPEELEALGESFENATWGLDSASIPPDFEAQAAWGNSWNLGGAARLGTLLSTNWANQWNVTDSLRNVYAIDGAGDEILTRTTVYDQLENRIVLGGLATVGLSWKDATQVTSTFLLNRVANYEAVQWFADDPTSESDSQNYSTSWVEQQLLFQQFTGTHPIAARRLVLDWRYAFSQANREEPDRREWRYADSGDDPPFINEIGTWNEIAYLKLRDVNHDGAADLTIVANPKSEVKQSFKFGAAAVSRKRNSTSRRFTYSFDGTEGIDLTAPIVDIITPENIGADEPDDPAYLSVHEVTSNSDDYEARQKLRAAYAMADLGLGNRFRLMGGARVESSRQSVRTFELFNPQLVPVEAVLDTTDLLPAFTGTLAIGPAEERDRMLVRAGYGRTLSRPEFRELSSVAFTDFLTGALLKGNPDLERAIIDNIDVRWELYPSPNESLSVAAFYKDFTDPIERVAQSSSVSGLAYTFGNAQGATNLGVELDLRITFGRVSDVLRDMYVSANGALIESSVDLSGSVTDTSTERPLQGQSPWVINVAVGYDNPDSGVSLSVLYNSFGPRITDVGQSGVPDTYELPVHRLDAVALVPFERAWRLRLKATNLLNAKEVSKTGDAIAEESRSGRAFSLAIQWRPPAPER